MNSASHSCIDNDGLQSFQQLEMRETKESATETSELYVSTDGDLPPFYHGFPSTSSDAKAVVSPGRAVVVIAPGSCHLS